MIFSSPEYIFIFLPLSIFLYYGLLRSRRKKFIAPFIFAISLFYYGWWRPANIWVILVSILVNFSLARAIERTDFKRLFFITGIIFNLGALGYFKYTDFAIDSVNKFFGFSLALPDIILPLGISFFTFQQIAYLSDIYTGKQNSGREGFFDYCCFVCFFPQLVAGPIVHHQEMMPQFHDETNHVVNWDNIYNGLVMLCIGLSKKVLIADQLSPVARACFDNISSLTFMEAFLGSLCYSFQLYFDFSAYSDMAIGCALFFNIKLPWNFNSPYKAVSIQDFWRRWHITLSRWLKDYLYIPLGGNRKGSVRTYGNLFMTFLLGGIWHGAGWTFMLWGIMHGIALVMHRLWKKMGLTLPKFIGWILTFSFINLAWVVFRAPNMERLEKFFDAFAGYNGFWIRDDFAKRALTELMGSSLASLGGFLAVAMGMAFFAPNTYAIFHTWTNRQKFWLIIIFAILSLFLICLPFDNPEFIYSQF